MQLDGFQRIPCNERPDMACGHGLCTNYTDATDARIAALPAGSQRVLAAKPAGLGLDWVCVCEDGWSGRSAFLDIEGFLCNSPVLLEQARK